MLRPRSVIAALALAATAAAQGSFPVGHVQVGWTNPSAIGSSLLLARVSYPAASSGPGAPLWPAVGGWPTVVFLHGYSLLGTDYHQLCDSWAAFGLIVVALDTGQWNHYELLADATAVLAALPLVNSSPGLLAGAFQLGSVGLAGHSMGGGSAALVLANNPGYRCGLALAPVFPGPVAASQVTVPFGILVGEGDGITPAGQHADPLYAAVNSLSGFKFRYLLDGRCDHMNVAALPSPSPLPARLFDITGGFLHHFLGASRTALERLAGPDALADGQLLVASLAVTTPQVWISEELRLGTRVRLSILAEQGAGSILGAAGLGPPTSLPIGTLLLDAGTLFRLVDGWVGADGRLDAFFDVPSTPELSGVRIGMQAAGTTVSTPFQLGAALLATFQR